MSAPDSDATMAVFLDLENIAIGAHEAQFPAFEIRKVIERLLLKRTNATTPDECEARARFIGKFQQITSPVAAEG